MAKVFAFSRTLSSSAIVDPLQLHLEATGHCGWLVELRATFLITALYKKKKANPLLTDCRDLPRRVIQRGCGLRVVEDMAKKGEKESGHMNRNGAESSVVIAMKEHPY